MEIELVTTKKRLTKAVVNQMHILCRSEFLDLSPEGVGTINYHKDFDEVHLVRLSNGEYRIIPSDFNTNSVREIIFFDKDMAPIRVGWVCDTKDRAEAELAMLYNFTSKCSLTQIFLTS